MTQEIIVYAILALTVIYISYNALGKLRAKKSSSCHDGCSSCSLVDGNTKKS